MKSRPGTPSFRQLGLTPAEPIKPHLGMGTAYALLLFAFLSFPAAFSVALAWFTLKALLTGDHLP